MSGSRDDRWVFSGSPGRESARFTIRKKEHLILNSNCLYQHNFIRMVWYLFSLSKSWYSNLVKERFTIIKKWDMILKSNCPYLHNFIKGKNSYGERFNSFNGPVPMSKSPILPKYRSIYERNPHLWLAWRVNFTFECGKSLSMYLKVMSYYN